uniref:Uncharacterized protein n=1 Tax=Salix viminalis TaxID=40686 RepID=A0A6N2N627_SALVM
MECHPLLHEPCLTPPKFTSSTPAARLQDKNNSWNKTMHDAVPDTLVKLMEYGEEDDDPEETDEESPNGKSSVMASCTHRGAILKMKQLLQKWTAMGDKSHIPPLSFSFFHS